MNDKNMQAPKTMAEMVAVVEAKRAAGIVPTVRPIRVKKLETLNEEMRDNIMAYAERATVDQVRHKLASWGYDVSRATVGRFVQGQRHEEAMRNREAMAAQAKKLSEEKQEEAWRSGTLEALRQKLFDRAMSSGDPEEAMKMYGALVTEEERLKKLEIEQQRAQMQREGLELQRLRLQAESARGNGRLLLEALRILRDEALEDRVKVVRAIEQLQRGREGVLEIGVGSAGMVETVKVAEAVSTGRFLENPNDKGTNDERNSK